jgi:hypothetical protein
LLRLPICGALALRYAVSGHNLAFRNVNQSRAGRWRHLDSTIATGKLSHGVVNYGGEPLVSESFKKTRDGKPVDDLLHSPEPHSGVL